MKINEIFKGIQGETSFQGLPSVFIRTTGCNLRCRWCDTTYAYFEGTDYTIAEILKIVEKYACPELNRRTCKYIVITGGEPLMQEETPSLITQLIQNGYKVLVETNGSMDISRLHPEAIKILDIKCPDSGMTENICWQNIEALSPADEVKFVAANYDDYKWAKAIIEYYKLAETCTVIISTVFGRLDPKILA